MIDRSYTQDKAYRRWRASRLSMPIKVRVRQPDGSTRIQWVDASVKRDKRRKPEVLP